MLLTCICQIELINESLFLLRDPSALQWTHYLFTPHSKLVSYVRNHTWKHGSRSTPNCPSAPPITSEHSLTFAKNRFRHTLLIPMEILLVQRNVKCFAQRHKFKLPTFQLLDNMFYHPTHWFVIFFFFGAQLHFSTLFHQANRLSPFQTASLCQAQASSMFNRIHVCCLKLHLCSNAMKSKSLVDICQLCVWFGLFSSIKNGCGFAVLTLVVAKLLVVSPFYIPPWWLECVRLSHRNLLASGTLPLVLLCVFFPFALFYTRLLFRSTSLVF